jgi:excisionase family DNA binding protein
MSEQKQMALNYFGPDDDEITVDRAATMLRLTGQAIRMRIQAGDIRAYQPYPGAWYRISKKSILEILERIERQKRGEEPLPERGK